MSQGAVCQPSDTGDGERFELQGPEDRDVP
jgi:hypothetical protein